MKIRTQADILQLEAQIKDELDIDIRKYNNQEVRDNFIEMGESFQSIMDWQRRIGLGAMIAYMVGFSALDLKDAEYLVYGIGGFLFIGAFAFCALSVLVTIKMKFQIKKTIEFSIEIMRWCLNDLRKMEHILTPANRANTLGLLFKGTTHIITIPLLTKLVTDKVPLIGGLLKRLIRYVLTEIADHIQYDENRLKAEMEKPKAEESVIDFYLKALDLSTKFHEKTLSFFMGISLIPLVGGLVISLVCFFIIVLVVH
ncbi:MAG: hypothetical protein AB8B69_05365 [Chitinophagales bacterium]